MVTRYGRLEERKQKKRLFLAVFGIAAVFLFLLLFGFRILIGFSLLLERFRSASVPATPSTKMIIFPPVLDPVPMATKSGTISISGSGQPGLTMILYINDQETKQLDVTKSGTFKTILSNLKDGVNSISAKLTDNKGNFSDLSNVLTVEIKQKQPMLEVSSPNDQSSILGDNNLIYVAGKTDDNTTITINGRFVVVRSDNTFTYQYPLNQGANTLTIVATDDAGNSTTIERKVTYQK